MAPKLTGSMLNFTSSTCASIPSASRKPASSRASSLPPVLAISTHVVLSPSTTWNGSSPTSLALQTGHSSRSADRASLQLGQYGIAFLLIDESDDPARARHPADVCIEQAAGAEPRLEPFCLRRR